jgi:hypothetical protein
MFLREREGEFDEEKQFYRVADRLYFKAGRGRHSEFGGVSQVGYFGVRPCGP